MGKTWEFFTIFNSTLLGSSQTSRVNITISCVDNDNDNICSDVDNCPYTYNPDQNDTDGDGIGNVCDNCVNVNNTNQTDSDNDGIGNVCDNCPYTYNPDQNDTDGDGYGDACECLQPYVITQSKNVTQNQLFTFESGVKCVCSNCGNVTATLDPAAIYCTDSPCIASSGLIRSRGNITPVSEPNHPNTIDNCRDGSSGTYLSDESIENITITDLNGTSFQPGDTVQVDIWVYCYSSSDNLNFIYTSNIVTPLWVVKGSYNCPGSGFKNFSKKFVLDNVFGEHAIRGSLQYSGSPTRTCGNGSYDDNDDLIISVGSTLSKGIIPMNNGTPFYTINNNPQICSNMLENQTCNKT
ncbi:MAG: hypothetical protein CVT89_07655, partial [Candidatus Altiarchaeales archaeon HGW-Altiarchaeales-2]